MVVPETKRSAPARKPTPRNHTDAAQFTAYRAENGYQADAEDRDDARFRAEASARGYKLATKCLDCGHYVVNEVSVRAHRGPVCRKRHAEAVTA